MRFILVTIAIAAVIVAQALASAGSRASVAVHASRYGRILFDGRGFALYTFTRDLLGSRPAAGVGGALLGTIRCCLAVL
jgi:predicted lipoprotein with Yx(FWY)xxD motif